MHVNVHALAIVTTVACAGPALAQSQPFGPGFDNWTFSATREARGVTNCRAVRKVGGRDDIVALKTDGQDYMSVRADGRTGKWPGSFMVPFREPSSGMQYDMTAEANGQRMWFPTSRGFIELVMRRGGYEWFMGGTEDRDRVPLGGSAAKAFVRLQECIVASGG